MLKIAIVDDEEILAKSLADIVADYMKKQQYPFSIDIFTSGEEFTALGIAMSDYKIVCLDMKMDHINGMTVARKLREYSQDIQIIFVTAYMDFALEGYEVGAVRYIIKDNDDAFVETMHAALNEACRKKNRALDVQMFHFKEGDMKLAINRIAYVETGIHKVIFHVKEDSSDQYRKYSLRETLANIEERLSKHDFLRIHKSYLVNFRYVQSMVNYKAVLSDQTVLSIPRNKYRDIKSKYLIYLSDF